MHGIDNDLLLCWPHLWPPFLCLAAAGCPTQDTLEESRASVKNSFWRSTASPTNTGVGAGRTTTSTTGQWKEAVDNQNGLKMALLRIYNEGMCVCARSLTPKGTPSNSHAQSCAHHCILFWWKMCWNWVSWVEVTTESLVEWLIYCNRSVKRSN